MFGNYINKRIDERVKNLLSLDASDGFRMVPDNVAKEDIKFFLVQSKKKGITELTTYDIVSTLKLPVRQVENIMQTYIESNLVKEI